MLTLDQLRAEVLGCSRCPLWRSRTNAVPGEGSRRCPMFVGEAPGANEDAEGRPFVGAAGKFLTKLIEDVLGLSRTEVYITNLVKCRPPKNREPTPEEEAACWSYLEREISLVKPTILVTLGRHSSAYVLSRGQINFKSIESVRGRTFKVKLGEETATVFPTYHPAAALYNPSLKEELESDFRKLKAFLGGGLEKYLI
ncbi:type-4 uracil-DNA glycosylase [Sulfodiicoccus acidiphilus]|nr:type-4 uracil-DNA glycosylase [Sulfodiicoccus acidiphilus]